MEPQTNQDQGFSVPNPPSMAGATMPLPHVPGRPLQSIPAPAATPPQAVPAAAPPLPGQTPAASASPPISGPIASPVLRPTVPVHPVQPSYSPAVGQQAASSNAMPTEAADTDVIEKEWVYKAKQVVAETRQDPYLQVREINKLKADYMQKRYNKELKLPEA